MSKLSDILDRMELRNDAVEQRTGADGIAWTGSGSEILSRTTSEGGHEELNQLAGEDGAKIVLCFDDVESGSAAVKRLLNTIKGAHDK